MPKITRMQFLAAGTAVAGGGLLALGEWEPATAATAGTKDAATGRPGSAAALTAPAAPAAAPTPFTERMPVPRVLEPERDGECDHYRIPIRPGTAEILPGLRTAVYTYGSDFLAPTIRTRAGRRVRVTFGNQLDEPTNVHLHGGHVAAGDDGHPLDVIQPGAQRDYTYPNGQRASTLWYHSHAHMMEGEHTYKGLHGTYIIEDPIEDALGLPRGDHDVPIQLRDAQFDADGALVFGNPALRTTLLANGKVQPYFPVEPRPYRFRLMNVAVEGIFQLTLDGAPMTQIGTDGGLLPQPVPRTDLTMASGERVDVVVDFSGCKPGDHVVLADSARGAVVRFDVGGPASNDSRLPQRLRPLPAMPPATSTRDVVLSFDLSGPQPVGLVNGRPYDPNRVDFTIRRGTTEIWNIVNADGAMGFQHNFHMHLTMFRVLDRTGAPMTPNDAGLKDTVLVPPGTSVRVQATFDGFLGRYAYHCHFMEHADVGMMAQMEIVP